MVKPETARPNTRKRKRGEPKPVLPIPPEKRPIHTPWIDTLPAMEYESKEQRLHDEIVAHASYILPTPAERLARQALYDQIASVLVRGKWRNAKLHLYGSISTDLCLPRSDMDLVFEIHQIADTQEACKSVLFEAKRYLFEQQYLAEELFVVAHARVPVLNMVSHPQTGRFNVDITVNGADGVPTIAPVKEYLKTMPALRPLVLLIKSLLEQHGLHSAQSSGLSSYCVICMVISFLQINPKKRPQKWVDDPVASESFGWLLLDFLEYYGVEPRVPERPPRELPPVSQDIIDLTSTPTPPPSEPSRVSKGNDTPVPVNEPEAAEEGEVPKDEHNTESEALEDDVKEETFDPSNGFPYMTHYISVREGTLLSKKKKGWLRENVWENGRLCIECLVNRDNDIARSAGKIKAVRQLFREAKARLERATLDGTGHNILGTIIGVTQETLDFRENIRTLVEQGRIRPFAEAQAPSSSWSYNDSRNRSGHSQYNNAQRTGGGGSNYNGGFWSGGRSAPPAFSGGRSTSNYSRGEGSRGNEGVYKRQKR